MMRKVRALWMRLCGLLRKPQGDIDFEAEIASHLAMHTDDGIRAGLSSEEARRRALIRLGGVEQTRQAYRERRGLPWLESFALDLAYSLRRLVQRPAITAIAVLSIGLGIGGPRNYCHHIPVDPACPQCQEGVQNRAIALRVCPEEEK
jgi:hypothetical protein